MLSAGIALGGCSALPDYAPPQMQLTDRYSVLQPISVGSRAQSAWWTAFHDPVLDRLVERALAQNLTIAQARARVREAEALARRAGLEDINGNLEASASAPDSTETAGLDAEFVLSPRRIAAAIAARARLDAARADETDARRLVIGELALAYADLRFSQALLAYRHQDLSSRQRTLSDINTRFEAGAATRLDRVRAEALVAQTRAQIPQTEAQVAILHTRIATLLGEPAGRAGVDLGGGTGQPIPRGAADIGVPADLLRARPDIRAAERSYAAAVSELGAARADRYPRLSLSGFVRAPIGGGSVAEGLVAGIALPVFSQPRLAAAEAAAEARVEQALLDWKNAVLTAVDEVESALIALAASMRTASAAAEVVRLNQEALDLSRQLLSESGGVTVLDILDRERAVADARATLAQAQRDVARDYIRLYTALGLEDGLGAPLEVAAAPVK
ncbi:MAG: efflux transporter outer membrane subunit [Rhodobacteraceae bacterium]|nr:efflux transporter outer membrane subunit [Paracoccaceae bacterium]